MLPVMLACVSAASAQYPGKITKSDGKPKPVLRAVSVLEWTGEPGKPSASRLVPVAVFDGEHLNDGTIYLNRPEPLALESGVEYELQMDGKPQGVFDVFGAGETQGAWRGYGTWRPLSAATQKTANEAINTSSLYAPIGGDDDDKPVLKRKHPREPDADSGTDSGAGGKSSAGETSADKSGGAGIGSGTGTNSGAASSSASNADPDRPTLKRKADSDSTSSGTGSTAGSGSGSASGSGGSVDPDRPTLRRSHHTTEDSETQNVSTVPPDPNRPRLKRGKPSDLGPSQAPRLEGFPPTMQQAVAVSDAGNHTEHPWKYTWANPEDEKNFKKSLEAMARTELGLDAPPAPAKPAKAAAKAAPGKKTRMVVADPPAPVELADEEFKVFELTYGGSATMVLTAATPLPAAPVPADSSAGDAKAAGSSSAASAPSPDDQQAPVIRRGKPTSATAPLTPTPGLSSGQAAGQAKGGKAAPVPARPAPQKFVTLIAQPDLYGGVLVIYKSVTDAAHLDVTPRLKLVDAVDAMGDNRGELLFEMRGDQQRQFALFRVLRGSASQLFATVAIPGASGFSAE
jgi:hypothetical protein